MAANSINVFVLVSSNPDYSQGLDDFHHAPADISFHTEIDSDIRTLSTNGVTSSDDIDGFLYVPDLNPSDPCVETSKPYVPANVTRQGNLPTKDYDLVALAPWISANCTLSYLAAARSDPARAFIFYRPDHHDDRPPPINDASWTLNDGGQWKSRNRYPVYAVSGQTGDLLMTHLARYSGNLTEVEQGHELAEWFDPRDYARLYADIPTNFHTPLPSIWMFLSIVIGVVLFVSVLSTSIMYCILRRRRASLRRRVANGEVDLEALGIRQLTVPNTILNALPTFIYVEPDDPKESTQPGKHAASDITECILDDVKESRVEQTNPDPDGPAQHTSMIPLSDAPVTNSMGTTSVQANTGTTAAPRVSYTQSTCAICLEDFVNNMTIIRQLPCGHIFHPGCVDDFLRKKSSLCPMCKVSVLPRGYCPANLSVATIRRERMVGRMRERVDVPSDVDETGRAWPMTESRPMNRLGAGRRMLSFHRHLGRARRTRGGRQAAAAVVGSENSVDGDQTMRPAALPP